MADSTSAAREKAWREYADKIEVDYTAPTVQDDFKAGWDALVAVLGPRLAKAEQRCKELEAIEQRARHIKRLLDGGQVWPHRDKTPVDYILAGDWSDCIKCKRPSYRTENGLCYSCRAPSSEPAPSDGACVDDFGRCYKCGGVHYGTGRDCVFTDAQAAQYRDGFYIDAWEALTPEQRAVYMDRAQRECGDYSLTSNAAFAIAQRMARDDAKKGHS